jgi:hypothetical protein
MITSLRLGNFKAFGPVQEIPIRPLTLIYGPNSAGKSSILHSLLFAHEAITTGKVDVHYTSLGGNAVDLGGFRQFVFKRQTDQAVEWSAETFVRLLGPSLTGMMMHGSRARITSYFNLARLIDVYTTDLSDEPKSSTDAGETQKNLSTPSLSRYDFELDGMVLLSLGRRAGRHLRIQRIDFEHKAVRDLLKQILSLRTWKTTVTDDDVTQLQKQLNENLTRLEVTAKHLFPNRVRWNDETELRLKRDARSDPHFDALLAFPQALSAVLTDIENFLRESLDSFAYLGPLRSYPERHFALGQSRDSDWHSGGGFAWDTLREDASVREKINQWLGGSHLQTPYRLGLRRLIAPLEAQKPTEDAMWEIYGDLVTKPFDVESNPDGSEHPKIEFHDWSMEDYTARVLRALVTDPHLEGFNDLAFQDIRTKTIVSHRDIGIGVSQVLPVLVHAFAAERRTIAIEQPEIHLHPALQAELADVFIGSMSGERHNHFLLETHSEHLLLRIMRRMRETQENRLPEGIPAIHPHDVAVLYVNPTPNGSVVMELPLNERGELVKPWPGGFFEEGLRETFA